MNLKDYLGHSGQTQAQFGEAVGVSQQAVWLWLSGRQGPNRKTMLRIISATNGAVTPNDFLPVSAPSILPEPCEATE